MEEAYTERWWMARIISTRSRDDGFILVSGAYRIKPDAIRMLEGDGSPALTKQGAEDAHFIGEEHWFVGNAAMPANGDPLRLSRAPPQARQAISTAL